MATKEMCKNCAYLYEGNDASWMCDDFELKIEDVPEDACFMRYEFILGQDHDWWVYDNIRELYRCLYAYGKTVEEAKEIFLNDLKDGIPEDNWVDVDDV